MMPTYLPQARQKNAFSLAFHLYYLFSFCVLSFLTDGEVDGMGWEMYGLHLLRLGARATTVLELSAAARLAADGSDGL